VVLNTSKLSFKPDFMKEQKPRWIVIETPMFPAKFKVCRIGKELEDNSTHNYFRSKEEAWNEADKRNKQDEAEAL